MVVAKQAASTEDKTDAPKKYGKEYVELSSVEIESKDQSLKSPVLVEVSPMHVSAASEATVDESMVLPIV